MKGNTIVIEDSSISLMHAKITRKNGDFLLKDLNSTNGTSVNGQPIGEVRLRDSDRVRFAEITCQFIADAPVPSEQPTQTVAAPAPIPITPSAVAQPWASPNPTAAPLPARSPSPVQAGRAPAIAAPMPSQTKAKSFSLWALRYAGALLVVGVVSVAAWRFFQINREGSSKSENAPTGTLEVAAKPLVASKSPPAASRDEKRSPESGNGLPNRIPEAADTEPPTQNAAAEQKTESATESLPQLVEALKNQDVAERQRAAAALHSMGARAKEAIPALREALKDQDQDVQMWAALALVNNQEFDKTVVPVLVRALQKDNPVLRQVACLSLGLIPYLESEKETVIPPLSQTAEKDANEDVRKAALSALSIIAPESVGKRAAK
jgi:FOG: FHA domain